GGIQHAQYKPIVQDLMKKGLYLGPILAGQSFEAFWQPALSDGPLFQLAMQQYLQNIDNGWILRRARYYRGAFQAEDESAWGSSFLTWLVGQKPLLEDRFFVMREAVRILPHSGSVQDEKLWESIRANSRILGDSLPEFMDLRVKLHGQPEAGDLKTLQQLRGKLGDKLKPEQKNLADALEADLKTAFLGDHRESIRLLAAQLGPESPLAKLISDYLEESAPPQTEGLDLARILWNIRTDIATYPAARRIVLLDLSLALERRLFQVMSAWKPQLLNEVMNRFTILSLAAAGCGYLERWEWDAFRKQQPSLPRSEEEVSVAFINQYADGARRLVEWGVGMIRAWYMPTVKRFAAFEPLANGFPDNRIRGTILLPLGESAARLRDISGALSGIGNRIFDLANAGQYQGLNPGFAKGELVVVEDPDQLPNFLPDKIYAMSHPPADLKPVAGILTVSQGNLVSHVQLLARNLGIPNAVLSPENFADLAAFNGKSVFMAVSSRGAVILKTAEAMTPEEKGLFDVRKSPSQKLRVPVDRMNLREKGLLNLRELRSDQSGITVGPKAANLGELKHIFPNKVVEGFAIPFGVFREHLDQPMPDGKMSYWRFLNSTFEEANRRREQGQSEAEVEDFVTGRLAELRLAISAIPFLPHFQKALETAFADRFGTAVGGQPVFIRSDTNMEDLADFTGAGLNLTVFNVVGEGPLGHAIRSVWASPYSERSYRWRQKFLLNPENVFPSILVIPTVNVDRSGVMITTGIASGNPQDLTVAFSRGAGGAVEGQASETWLLSKNEDRLLSPSRERIFNVLPESGGVSRGITDFGDPILDPAYTAQLREMAATIQKRMARHGNGPWDVELGFLGEQLWLFQVRPFVENKKARSSLYLQSLDPESDPQRRIPLRTPVAELLP
ncbi:MAG TPA: PEP/pyruvate-binding domain-containing protein, partial [Calditrichia bacterium]|nr:PEP/pyruvate-binding domain-containing protein [Calditrichia bacterium]